MSLLFKMHKTLVTFSLILILKLRSGYLIFQNFRETQNGTWYHKTFKERGEIRKIKIHMWNVWLLTCSLWLWTWKKDKVQVPQPNEM